MAAAGNSYRTLSGHVSVNLFKATQEEFASRIVREGLNGQQLRAAGFTVGELLKAGYDSKRLLQV
jgi:hypothetical protein